VKVYFNNSCKICRTEINLYKKQNIKILNGLISQTMKQQK